MSSVVSYKMRWYWNIVPSSFSTSLISVLLLWNSVLTHYENYKFNMKHIRLLKYAYSEIQCAWLRYIKTWITLGGGNIPLGNILCVRNIEIVRFAFLEYWHYWNCKIYSQCIFLSFHTRHLIWNILVRNEWNKFE